MPGCSSWAVTRASTSKRWTCLRPPAQHPFQRHRPAIAGSSASQISPIPPCVRIASEGSDRSGCVGIRPSFERGRGLAWLNRDRQFEGCGVAILVRGSEPAGLRGEGPVSLGRSVSTRPLGVRGHGNAGSPDAAPLVRKSGPRAIGSRRSGLRRLVGTTNRRRQSQPWRSDRPSPRRVPTDRWSRGSTRRHRLGLQSDSLTSTGRRVWEAR